MQKLNMNKRSLIAAIFLFVLFNSAKLYAQADTVKKAPVYHVGIFAPLFLDSVFSSNNNFKYKQGLPRFIMPAVDFVQGAQIALDTMQAGTDKVNAAIYDTKSYTQPVPWLIQNKRLDSLNLIIGSVKDAEYLQLAEFAQRKNIPFISVTYPNDGGITGNPSLVIVNSTLKSHCEAIYSYILQNHGTDKIYLCRQKGEQEDMVASYFKQINEQEGKPLLPIQILNLDNKLDAAVLKARLDSNRHSVIIGASLSETFATNLSLACFELYKSYPITLIGMPTWDGFASLQKKNELPNFPIYFTSPYFNNKWDDLSKMITTAYQKKYKGKPTDMTFKGFEAVYLFTRLMAKYPNDFMGHINDRNMKVFSDFNFRPVLVKKQVSSELPGASTPDYYENKHLYFIKILNGSVSRAW
jgi:Periplasmic binding protein